MFFKKFLLFVGLLFITLPAFSEMAIKGTILDAGNQTPMEFVNVTLYKPGSETPVVGVTSDKDGVFFLPAVEKGKYILKLSFVGYNTVSQPVEITAKAVNVGIIKLTQNSESLKEVEVVGQGSQMHFEIDKKVFSVDQNIAASGGSASDVLKNIPSVTVDNQGNVSLRKDGNVEVWINGKASGLTADNRAQVLQQLPAESIQSIEIMTNPSAKYNPEGSAGIINIVLKQNRKAGYYGSLTAGIVYPDGGKVGSNLGASVNYSSSKFDAYINLGYRAMNFNGGGKTDRLNFAGNETTLLSQNNSMQTSYSGLFMRAGVDYHLDLKNTLSLSGFGMNGSGNQNTLTHYTLSNYISFSNALLLRDYTRNNISDGYRPSLDMNMDYKHDFDKKGSNLMASLAYSYHNRGGITNYIQQDVLTNAKSNISQNTDGKSKTYDFKVDYTKKFNENNKLEAGWQSTLNNRLSASSGVDSLAKNGPSNIPSYYNSFDYNEQIHAAYLTYGSKIDKLTFQIGARTELLLKESTNTTKKGNTNSDTTQTIPSKSFFHIFPSFYLSYSLPHDAELQFNYTNRVNRSRGQQINPYRDYSDSTNISYGNPDLLPQYSSSLELNYIKSWGAQSLSGSLYYKYTDNVVQNVRFLHNGVMESTYMNIAKSQNSGLELIAKNRLFKILSLTSSLNMYYSQLNASVYTNPYNPTITTTIPEQSNFSWSGNIMANFMLSKTFSGQITGEYDSPRLIAQGTRNASYSIDFGIRKTFLNRKFSLSLNVRDLLNSDRERSSTSGAGFSQTTENYFHGRMGMLTLSYNFGNMKPKPSEMKKQATSAPDMMDNGE